jgi:hypothetical protein
MRGENTTDNSSRKSDVSQSEFLERRRQYNRQYMRSWRANPDHKDEERERRKRWYYERKERAASAEKRPYRNANGKLVCGFCGLGSAVTEVVRLRICDRAPNGFLTVRIPYCGEC